MRAPRKPATATPAAATTASTKPALGTPAPLALAHRDVATTLDFADFRDVPPDLWRWKNFSPAEIACRGTGALKLVPEALDKLQALRDRLGKPLILRSAYRSPAHNRAVGGAKVSKHMDGTAFDIAMSNHDPAAFEAAAREVGFLGFGFYPRSGFMHIDLGPARVWGEQFPMRAVPFAMETPPARETLAESRTLRGTGTAGLATVGAAGVEVAQEVVAEAQGAVLPLVPYLDSLRWLFIALALGGIALAVWARVDDWKKGRR
jgi:zinc D-Ala-D-Ala carboxypeptidase